MDFVGKWTQISINENFELPIDCQEISENMVTANSKVYIFETSVLRSQDHNIVGTFRNGDYIEWQKGSKYFATWKKSGDLF